jgi:hypothetical protein
MEGRGMKAVSSSKDLENSMISGYLI